MKAKNIYKYEPDYAVPPGETLREVMESLDMTQRDLALRTELTVQTLNRIFNGVQPITYETANKLELATGVSARMWNNLEAQYREQLAKMEEKKRLEKSLEWLKVVPVRELVQRKEIEAQSEKVLMLRETLGFYGVSSVEAWNNVWDTPQVAARRSECFETRIGSASAWIRIGEREAQKIKCAPYNEKKFKSALIRIRALTRETPQVFEPEMKKLCAEAGVAVVLVPEFKKVPWNGATKWLAPDKVMILLNIRGKGDDKFWFSFFHEAGHVLHPQKKCVFINDGKGADENERKADEFASDFLIPSIFNEEIKAACSARELKEIAENLGVSPGIVAGRYQFLTKKWSFYKDLISSLQWGGVAIREVMNGYKR